jgi:hypothetical protein
MEKDTKPGATPEYEGHIPVWWRGVAAVVLKSFDSFQYFDITLQVEEPLILS